MPFHELEKDVEPFLGRQVSIKLVVGLGGIVEIPEYLNDSHHLSNFITVAATPPFRSPQRASHFRNARAKTEMLSYEQWPPGELWSRSPWLSTTAYQPGFWTGCTRLGSRRTLLLRAC